MGNPKVMRWGCGSFSRFHTSKTPSIFHFPLKTTKILVEENTVLMVFHPKYLLATFTVNIYPFGNTKLLSMKRLTFICTATTAIVYLLFIGNGCSKSSEKKQDSTDNPAGGTTPKASNDNQSGGIYKGTLTGSSGFFLINLQATKPYLIYQWTNPAGAVDSLLASSLGNWQTGQAISKALFTGPSGAKFWFSVGANGSNPMIDSLYLPAHPEPVFTAIAKETSVNPIKVYQGTGAATSSNGGKCGSAIVNIWTGGSVAMGTYLAASGEHGSGTGTISGNQLQIMMGNESGTLTISNDATTISGTAVGNTCSHIITLKRIF